MPQHVAHTCVCEGCTFKFQPRVSIIIPKQTAINKPDDAYLSECRRPHFHDPAPHLLLRPWGEVAMATDSSTYGEREREGRGGAALEGYGGGGD